MPVNIKTLGLKAYLNRVYAEQGGYKQWRLMNADPKIKIKDIALHFGVDRNIVPRWRHADEEYVVPAAKGGNDA